MPNKNTIDRGELFAAFQERRKVVINGICGYIMAIALEDGSGKSYNLTINNVGSNAVTTHIRTN